MVIKCTVCKGMLVYMTVVVSSYLEFYITMSLLQVYARTSESIVFYEVNLRQQFKSSQAFYSQFRFARPIFSAVDKILCSVTCIWLWLWWQEPCCSFFPSVNISRSFYIILEQWIIKSGVWQLLFLCLL